MPDARSIRLALVSFGFLFIRILTATVVGQPGYTDAYYYVNVASRLARGLGLTADFVWSPLELGVLPIASHRFWMPMATTLQAAGIAAFGGFAGDFRAAQTVVVLVAACIPVATYLCARSLGAVPRTSLAAAALAGLGGLFAPAWVALDGFAIAALFGALFFLAYSRAAAGSVVAAAVAGILVGLLYLTRAEAALFGLALVALIARPSSRVAGIAGSVVALAIGVSWLARDLALGAPAGYLTRAFLLARYEDFFAVVVTRDVTSLPIADVVGVRLSAMLTNATTFLFAFAVILIAPLIAGMRAAWSRADIRAWTWLTAGVFVAESLLWTLHSTRGSYFHSLAAFWCFGIAIAAVGADRVLAGRSLQIATAWTWGALVLMAVLSFGAVAQWDAGFNGGARQRLAALDAIPEGSFLAIDAAAWRWLSGRAVLVTPADGLDRAACLLNVPEPHATSIVLEQAHFTAYEALYQGAARPDWLGAPLVRGTVKIFPVVSSAPCAIGVGP